MNIARPKAGFLLRERDQIAACLAKHAEKWPRLEKHWEGIKDRLKMTGHREGESLGEPGSRVFEAQGSIDSEIPVVRVAYHVLGDTITFLQIDVLDPSASAQ